VAPPDHEECFFPPAQLWQASKESSTVDRSRPCPGEIDDGLSEVGLPSLRRSTLRPETLARSAGLGEVNFARLDLGYTYRRVRVGTESALSTWGQGAAGSC
jgi:hypothetical protein